MQINPTQEFIKSIMSVLRLEQNIYTTGAIEKIIERLKVNDYQMFIAFLGERNADYEKPIENIAKGVDEFYNMKLEPHKQKAKEMQEAIFAGFDLVSSSILKTSEQLIDEEEVNTYVKEHYGKQSEDNQNNARVSRMQELKYSIAEGRRYKFFNEKQRDSEFWVKFIYSENKKPVFDTEKLNIIYSIGLEKLQDSYNNNLIFDYLFTANVKPSISEQVTLKEVEKIYEPELIADKTRKLLSAKKYTEVIL
tara:strand:- start:80 stop:829 length:750 start_codon:yes stop_codon:yes gene_type:complete